MIDFCMLAFFTSFMQWASFEEGKNTLIAAFTHDMLSECMYNVSVL